MQLLLSALIQTQLAVAFQFNTTACTGKLLAVASNANPTQYNTPSDDVSKRRFVSALRESKVRQA